MGGLAMKFAVGDRVRHKLYGDAVVVALRLDGLVAVEYEPRDNIQYVEAPSHLELVLPALPSPDPLEVMKSHAEYYDAVTGEDGR